MSIERPYFLMTPRLGFSHWTGADRAVAQALWGHPDVTAYIGGPFTRAQIADRLESELENQRTHAIQYWPVFSLGTGELAGCTGLRPHSENTLELGAHFLPAFWGAGYAHEATLAAIDHALNTLHTPRLIAAHHPQNRASQRLIQKLGFQFSHEALYAPTGLQHPWYILDNPSTSP